MPYRRQRRCTHLCAIAVEFLATYWRSGSLEPRRVDKARGGMRLVGADGFLDGETALRKGGSQLSLQLHSGSLRLNAERVDELFEEEIGPGFAWRCRPGRSTRFEAIEDSMVLEVFNSVAR